MASRPCSSSRGCPTDNSNTWTFQRVTECLLPNTGTQFCVANLIMIPPFICSVVQPRLLALPHPVASSCCIWSGICPFIKGISSRQTRDRFWYEKAWTRGYVISWWGCKHIKRSTFLWLSFVSEMFQTAFHTACSNVSGSDISHTQNHAFKIIEKSPLLKNVLSQIQLNSHALASLSNH